MKKNSNIFVKIFLAQVSLLKIIFWIFFAQKELRKKTPLVGSPELTYSEEREEEERRISFLKKSLVVGVLMLVLLGEYVVFSQGAAFLLFISYLISGVALELKYEKEFKKKLFSFDYLF